MLDVSNTYTQLMADANHYFEFSVAFGSQTANTGFRESQFISVETTYSLFAEDTPSVGGCLASELTLSMFAPDISIPRMAMIRPYVRVATDDSTHSEWIPQGVFFIDTREQTKNSDGRDILTIHAYDAMLKTEALFPSYTGEWSSKPCDEVVEIIAEEIGVEVDDRTYALFDTHEYGTSPPAGYSMREVLANIASMYAGNWIITLEGKLNLVPINGIPAETSLLTDEYGKIIMWGEDAISLVSTV